MEKQPNPIDIKIEYCRKCGSSLDSKRQCNGCGKQYFFISKSKILQLYAGMMTALSIFLVYNQYQTAKIDRADPSYDPLFHDVTEPDFRMSEPDPIVAILENPSFAEDRRLNPSYTSFDSESEQYITTTLFETEPVADNIKRILKDYQKHLDITVEANKLTSASKSIKEMQEKLDFYDNRVAFVVGDETIVHRYGCSLASASESYTYIVDKELSEIAEYTECIHCFD